MISPERWNKSTIFPRTIVTGYRYTIM